MINKVSKREKLVVLALFLSFPVLSYLKFPGSYSITSSLFLLAYLNYFKDKKLRFISKTTPLLIWLALTAYHWSNAMYKEVPEVNIIDLLHGLKIFACIALIAYFGSINFKKTTEILLLTFNIYLLLSFLVNDITSASLSGRMTGVIYSTALGQTAAVSATYLAYVSIINKWSIPKTALYYVLPLLVIFFTQSRNALAMIAIVMLGHSLAYAARKGYNIAKILTIILFTLTVSYFSFQLIIQNTSLGARLADKERTESMNSNNDRLTHTILDDIAGDRLVYYVKGWQFFEDSPVTGIGMWNYRFLSKSLYPLHSEYMVHLCEGGLIAAVLWLLFIYKVFVGTLNSRHTNYIKILAVFSIIQILFCGIYARVFFSEFFYPIFGLAIALKFNSTEFIAGFPVSFKNKR